MAFIEEEQLDLGKHGGLCCIFTGPTLTPLSNSEVALETHSLISIIAEGLLDRTKQVTPPQKKSYKIVSTLSAWWLIFLTLNPPPHTHTQSPIACQSVSGGEHLTIGSLTSRLPEAASHSQGANQSLERKTPKENCSKRHCLKSSEKISRNL